MSSAFMDELIRWRVISDLYKSCPELQFLKKMMTPWYSQHFADCRPRSFKFAYDLYVDGKKKEKVSSKKCVWHRILVNWLVTTGSYEVTGQWHIIENWNGEKDKHSYNDKVITTDRQEIVLELLATVQVALVPLSIL